MYLFLAFLLVPIIEIALFIQIGGAIGLWPTLGIVVLTAVLGTWLVRTQGMIALDQLRRSFSDLNDPTEPLAHGAMILVAGVLLLTPGFFTDAIGFLLLVPSVRAAVFRYVAARVTVRRFRMGPDPRPRSPHPQYPRGGDVIEGEYEEVTPRRNGAGRASGWTQGPERH